MSKKILIANRGEIACRIIRSVKAAGYQAVAIYSDADKHARFVKLANLSVALGGNSASESYLDIEKVIGAAISASCDAVHPGYGFLSENPLFAKRCAEEKIKFIGPSVKAIEVMGNKAAAKALMLEAKVPCIPGYQGASDDIPALKKEAQKIGYPLMIKAAAGGGGRGIRLVSDEKNFEGELASARKEALSAFGDDEIILEKALLNARHIEIQVMADQQGNTIHLGDRDCSVQRRHQKVIEEAPSPFMTEDLRKAMGEAAVNAAKAVNYEGAGTVEFLVDADRNFYFLEMNTRLQVEHPVSEFITGLDFVDLQLAIAEGKPLPLTQAQVSFKGHAIEVRLCAEDSLAGFIPQTGTLKHFVPATGEGIRIDHGFESGALVSPYYDSMLAKLICWGEDRTQALNRLKRALRETQVTGLMTNKNFLFQLLQNESFVSGNATTALIDNDFLSSLNAAYHHQDVALAALVFSQINLQNTYGELASWSNSEGFAKHESLTVGDKLFNVSYVQEKLSDIYSVKVKADSEEEHDCVFRDVNIVGDVLTYTTGTVAHKVCFSLEDEKLSIDFGERTLNVVRTTYQPALAKDAEGSGKIISRTEGLVIDVLVKEGDVVKKGDVLVVIEAMKMEHRHCADVDGKVLHVNTNTGVQVKSKTLLIEIEAENL